MDSFKSGNNRNSLNERNADDLFRSLSSLVKDMNSTPPAEGYRELIKSLKIQAFPVVVAKIIENQNLEEADGLLNNKETDLEEDSDQSSEFDPSKYFGQSSFTGNDSESLNTETTGDFYKPVSFDSPTLSINDKNGKLSQKEVFEMLRELRSIKRS